MTTVIKVNKIKNTNYSITAVEDQDGIFVITLFNNNKEVRRLTTRHFNTMSEVAMSIIASSEPEEVCSCLANNYNCELFGSIIYLDQDKYRPMFKPLDTIEAWTLEMDKLTGTLCTGLKPILIKRSDIRVLQFNTEVQKVALKDNSIYFLGDPFINLLLEN